MNGWSGRSGEQTDNRKLVLERAELTCYTVAYHLLAKEEEAVRAARSALLELSRCEQFWNETETMRRKRAATAAMKASLGEKRRTLLGNQLHKKSSEEAAAANS